MSNKILRRLNDKLPAEAYSVTHLYLSDYGQVAFCGAEWRYAAPLEWYLQENITNYDVCQECLATEEFAMAALAGV